MKARTPSMTLFGGVSQTVASSGSWRLFGRLCFAALLVLGAFGCATVRDIAITSDPDGAEIAVNGMAIGKTPQTYPLDFSRTKLFLVSASKDGFFPEEITVNEKSAPVITGSLRFLLGPNEAWRMTTVSEATNNWLRVQVGSPISETEAWQKMVDSVTGRYANIEQMDAGSGYIRTVYYVHSFKVSKHGRGDVMLRTRFFCTISSKSPLVYKLMIESEIRNEAGTWVAFPRIFKEDAVLIQEIQSRLGMK